MSKNRLLLLLVCVLGFFLLAQITACRASRNFGCPMDFSKIEIPQQINSYN